jgi:hypothetical protein
VAQAIRDNTKVLEPGQGRGLIALEGESAAGIALVIPAWITKGLAQDNGAIHAP